MFSVPSINLNMCHCQFAYDVLCLIINFVCDVQPSTLTCDVPCAIIKLACDALCPIVNLIRDVACAIVNLTCDVQCIVH